MAKKEEKCIFFGKEERGEQGGMPFGGAMGVAKETEEGCCNLSNRIVVCDGLEDKENCPHWSKKSGGEK